jgi:uncharacterized Zn-finger protein
MEKKFICPICGRDISRKDNYRVHLKSHNHRSSETKQPEVKDEKTEQANENPKEHQVNVVDSTEHSNEVQMEATRCEPQPVILEQ